MLQFKFVEPPGLPDKSLNPIAVDGLFKIPAAGTKAGLEPGGGWYVIPIQNIRHPEREDRKAFPLPEYPFNKRPAFEPLFFPQGEYMADMIRCFV